MSEVGCGHSEKELARRGPNTGRCKICLHRERALAYYKNNRGRVQAYWKGKRDAGHDWRRLNLGKALLTGAKNRAKKRGLEFSIQLEDIVIPKFCPVFGVELKIGDKRSHEYSPTLDRKDNTLGYVKGNVVVISWRANRIKSDATLQELKSLLTWLCK